MNHPIDETDPPTFPIVYAVLWCQVYVAVVTSGQIYQKDDSIFPDGMSASARSIADKAVYAYRNRFPSEVPGQ